ncbi:unnamed protein product [Lampetra planeri]
MRPNTPAVQRQKTRHHATSHWEVYLMEDVKNLRSYCFRQPLRRDNCGSYTGWEDVSTSNLETQRWMRHGQTTAAARAVDEFALESKHKRTWRPDGPRLIGGPRRCWRTQPGRREGNGIA